jgi:hypothetical protein
MVALPSFVGYTDYEEKLDGISTAKLSVAL